jgi:hypothetical protein
MNMDPKKIGHADLSSAIDAVIGDKLEIARSALANSKKQAYQHWQEAKTETAHKVYMDVSEAGEVLAGVPTASKGVELMRQASHYSEELKRILGLLSEVSEKVRAGVEPVRPALEVVLGMLEVPEHLPAAEKALAAQLKAAAAQAEAEAAAAQAEAERAAREEALRRTVIREKLEIVRLALVNSTIKPADMRTTSVYPDAAQHDAAVKRDSSKVNTFISDLEVKIPDLIQGDRNRFTPSVMTIVKLERILSGLVSVSFIESPLDSVRPALEIVLGLLGETEYRTVADEALDAQREQQGGGRRRKKTADPKKSFKRTKQNKRTKRKLTKRKSTKRKSTKRKSTKRRKNTKRRHHY